MNVPRPSVSRIYGPTLPHRDTRFGKQPLRPRLRGESFRYNAFIYRSLRPRRQRRSRPSGFKVISRESEIDPVGVIF